MNWRFKAVLQKILSTTRIGDSINHIPATLNKNHNSNVVLYQTNESIRKFNYCDIDLLEKKSALEIGTGYSLISPIVLALLGFQEIITVDITRDARLSTCIKQLAFLETPQVLNLIVSNSIYAEKEIISIIRDLKKFKTLKAILEKLNISYLAPYTFEDVLVHSDTYHYICSQVVLEHLPPHRLDHLFKFTEQVLKPDHYCVHTINFIDHFANPSFLQDKSISEFNFLKYSDQYWRFWAGNPIAYTNRLSYLYYHELCEKYNLKIVDFIGENYRERRELNPKLIHKDILNKYIKPPQKKDLTKYQRGTFVISK